MRRKWTLVALVGLAALATLPASAETQLLVGGSRRAAGNKPEALPPKGLVTLDIDGRSVSAWPFTGGNFEGKDEDPINLVFVGDVDPRQIRAALMSLDGDRTAFRLPAAFPFNCTWADAAGFNLTSWSEGTWASSPIQLQCGEYTFLRTHLRLFRYRGYTLGNAHFEVMAPGTADHFVLSWEFPEALVQLDLMRSGLLAAAPGFTAPITPAPAYKTIEPLVFNGVPPELRYALGLPTTTASAPVPIPNDGRASVLHLSGSRPIEPIDSEIRFVRTYGVIAPKPFCTTGSDYVKIEGPLDMHHHATLSDTGEYTFDFTATGMLTVTPVNPLTGVNIGTPVDARIRLRQHSVLNDDTAWGEDVFRKTLLGDPEQASFEKRKVGNQERYELDIDCGS